MFSIRRLAVFFAALAILILTACGGQNPQVPTTGGVASNRPTAPAAPTPKATQAAADPRVDEVREALVVAFRDNNDTALGSAVWYIFGDQAEVVDATKPEDQMEASRGRRAKGDVVLDLVQVSISTNAVGWSDEDVARYWCSVAVSGVYYKYLTVPDSEKAEWKDRYELLAIKVFALYDEASEDGDWNGMIEECKGMASAHLQGDVPVVLMPANATAT